MKNNGLIYYEDSERDFTPTKRAVKQLIKALKEDKDYYYSWQANIAMAFKDLVKYEFKTSAVEEGTVCMYTPTQIHEIANKAAKNFLNLLIQ